MDNKFDPYENFDPTQEQGSACGCNGIYWDMTTQTWRKRATRQPTKPDCSALETELKQAQAELESAKQDAANERITHANTQTELEKANARIAELEKANTSAAELEKANARIAELEKQLAEQPTVCDVLKAHLRPVQRLNGEMVYYVPNDIECEGLDAMVDNLAGEPIHSAAPVQ